MCRRFRDTLEDEKDQDDEAKMELDPVLTQTTTQGFHAPSALITAPARPALMDTVFEEGTEDT